MRWLGLLALLSYMNLLCSAQAASAHDYWLTPAPDTQANVISQTFCPNYVHAEEESSSDQPVIPQSALSPKDKYRSIAYHNSFQTVLSVKSVSFSPRAPPVFHCTR